jgi:hypothetical protein
VPTRAPDSLDGRALGWFEEMSGPLVLRIDYDGGLERSSIKALWINVMPRMRMGLPRALVGC